MSRPDAQIDHTQGGENSLTEEWFQSVLEEKLSADTASRSALAVSPKQRKEIEHFDAFAFVASMKEVLRENQNEGFVIGLKRKRDFATQFLDQYALLTRAQKLSLLLALSDELGTQDLSLIVRSLPSLPRIQLIMNVIGSVVGLKPSYDPQIAKNMRLWLIPVPEKFFILMGSVPQGSHFVLSLREELLHVLRTKASQLPKKHQNALEFLDIIMRDLFLTQAGVRLRQIGLSSRETLSFLIHHERVHRFQSLADLRRRIAGGPSRVCYGLFHPHIPKFPLVFVEIALTDHLVTNVHEMLEGPIKPSTKHPTHAIYYSISNTNRGLQGLNLASNLLFLSIERLKKDFPTCENFVTLSPVPNFRSWLQGKLQDPQSNHRQVFTATQLKFLATVSGRDKKHVLGWLKDVLLTDEWVEDVVLRRQLQVALGSICARYLLFERKGKKISDPVANFHLQNGAKVEKINFLANTQANGMRQSYGIMVNYKYCMSSVSASTISYNQFSLASVSASVVQSVWPASSRIFEGFDVSILDKMNISLFSRRYKDGEQISKRGSLPTSVCFISKGKVSMKQLTTVYLSEGSCFGEAEIVLNEPVRYTTKAVGVCEILMLKKQDLRLLFKKYPDVYKTRYQQALVTSSVCSKL